MHPVIGTRWWSTGLGAGARCNAAVVDVVPDKRFKFQVKHWSMNDTRPYGRRDQSTFSTARDAWDSFWEPQPRIPLAWLNTASVWRPLPRERWWWDHNRQLQVELKDLVVIDTVREGCVHLAKVQPDGTLERYCGGGISGGWGQITCHNFMRQYARIWNAHDLTGVAPETDLFPGVLYDMGYLEQHKVQVATADDVVRAVEDIAKAEDKIKKAKQVIAERKKALKIRPHKRKRKKKTPPKTAWERIMEDE